MRSPVPKALHSFYLVFMSLSESNYQYLATSLGYPSLRILQRWTAEQWTEISPSGGNILDGTPEHLEEVIDGHLSWGYPPCRLTNNWDAAITTLYLAVLAVRHFVAGRASSLIAKIIHHSCAKQHLGIRASTASFPSSDGERELSRHRRESSANGDHRERRPMSGRGRVPVVRVGVNPTAHINGSRNDHATPGSVEFPTVITCGVATCL
jgi:hypothetical protein